MSSIWKSNSNLIKERAVNKVTFLMGLVTLEWLIHRKSRKSQRISLFFFFFPSFQQCVGETNIVSTQDKKKITKDELGVGVSRNGELLKSLHV